MSFIRVLFSYKGRIRRHIFWLKSLLPAALLATAFPFIPDLIPYAGMAKLAGYMFLLWIVTAGLAKRLHDRDHTGWLQMLFTGPVIIMLVFQFLSLTQPWLAVGWFITGIVGVWIVAETGFIAGKSGHNQFGEDPALYHSVRAGGHWGHGHGHDSAETAPAEAVDRETTAAGNADRQPPALQAPGQPPHDVIAERASGDGRAEPDPRAAVARRQQSETRRQRIAELFSQPVSPNHSPESEIVPISMPSEPAAETEFAPERGDIDAQLDPDWDLAPDLDPEPEPPSPSSEPGLPAVDRETEAFIAKLLVHATDSAAHLRYLENAASGGNRWAKLEAAATFLTINDANGARTERAVAFLRDVAEAQESYLGVGKEASYFLGEIYRIGYRTIAVNEDLALKYLTRAASEGHADAKMGLAAVISKEKLTENAGAFTHPIIEAALTSREAAAALLQMLENDWSLSYQDGVMVVLRTLVDAGDHLAAKLYGKHLLETDEYKIAPLVLMRAQVLDDAIIDKIMDVVQSGQAEDEAINALVDCLNHHADKGDSYANYQMAVSYNNGIGVPQDDIMAFVHANLAASRVHGRERDHLTRLRDELRDILSEPELAEAQEIIRERFLK